MWVIPLIIPFLNEETPNISTPRPLYGGDMQSKDLMFARTHRSLASMRPWANAGDTIEKQTHIGKDGFQVSVDVQHFAPNEVSVKTVNDTIVINAKHEERQDEHSYVSRQFQRRYRLPEGFKASDVVSSISSDGILTVKAPPATPAVEGNVRHVQIQQTGPARLSVTNKMDTDESKTKSDKGKK